MATLALATRAEAQGDFGGSGNGFLFGAPVGSVSLRMGYSLANAGSDLFSFVTRQMTLRKSDFNTIDLDGDLAFRLAPQMDLVFGAAVAGMTSNSEFRDWMDNSGNPIEQSTTFERAPITATLKMYLQPRGRSIGRYAWIPATIAPYVGVGAGTMWYRFRQEGDFIDFATLNVFHDTFESSGFTPMAHLLAGFDYALGPRWAFTAETRYQFAKAPMSQDFSGFNRIDLSGLTATAGISLRF